jgi:hypothetical protein
MPPAILSVARDGMARMIAMIRTGTAGVTPLHPELDRS